MGIVIVGLLSEEEAAEITIISKIFLVSLRIKDLVAEQKVKDKFKKSRVNT